MAYNFPANPSLNQVYSYNGKTFKWNGVQWVVILAPTSTAAPVFVSTSPPHNPLVGYLWFNTTDNTLYVRVQSPSGEYWESTNSSSPPPPVNGQVIVSASPPTETVVGLLWFNTVDNTLYVRVDSPSGQYWEKANPPAPSSPTQAQVIVSSSPPLNPVTGLLWFNTVENSLYVRVQSPSGGYWELANSSIQSNSPPVTVSSSPPVNPSSGDLWFDPDNSNFSIWYNDIDGGQWVVIPYADNVITTEGGSFDGPIYANYDIPNVPNAYVTVDWVNDKIDEVSIKKSLLTGKGSLITATSPNNPVELQLGATGQFLKANVNSEKGVVWSDQVDCGDF